MDVKTYAKLRKEGARLGRAGLSQRVCVLVKDFQGGYIEAMVLAGRLQAIAHAASGDDYWREKVQRGYWLEEREIESFVAAPSSDERTMPGHIPEVA